MDESKPPIPSDELTLRPASHWKSDVVDAPNGPSVVVYCGSEEEVSRGFFMALRAMGVAVVEQPAEPAQPPVARAKP
jgi:hypothetical protein